MYILESGPSVVCQHAMGLLRFVLPRMDPNLYQESGAELRALADDTEMPALLSDASKQNEHIAVVAATR